MPSRLIKTGQLLLLVAMLSACGGHWVLLQSVAWTTMLVDFSKNSDLTGAITKTFDGQHPCSLCKQIKAGKATEKKKEARVVAEKLDLFHQPSVITLARPGEYWIQSGETCVIIKWGTEPPIPPPRVEPV